MKIGDFKFLTEEEKEAVNIHYKRVMQLQRHLEEIENKFEITCKELWKTIFEICPEFKHYKCTYNEEKGKVSVVGFFRSDDPYISRVEDDIAC